MKKRMKEFTVLFVSAMLAMTLLAGCADDFDEEYVDDEEYYDDEYYDDEEYVDGEYYDDEEYYDEYADDEGYYDDEYDDDSDSSGAGSYGDAEGYDFSGSLGSASELNGTTVIVSIYVDDNKTSWSGADSTKSNTVKYLGVATDWISAQCGKYGVNADFIYDWTANEDLYYTGTMNCDLTRESDNLFYDESSFVDNTVDTASIVSKYSADNVIYILFVNTPMSCTSTSATFNYSKDEPDYENEIITMYCACDGYEENPASYAHEMLHTFGAPDLYSADTQGDNYGITQDYVDYLESSYSNDIMYTTFDANTQDPYYDKITNELTEIDAYYVGLTDSSSVVSEWGFDASQH